MIPKLLKLVHWSCCYTNLKLQPPQHLILRNRQTNLFIIQSSETSMEAPLENRLQWVSIRLLSKGRFTYEDFFYRCLIKFASFSSDIRIINISNHYYSYTYLMWFQIVNYGYFWNNIDDLLEEKECDEKIKKTAMWRVWSCSSHIGPNAQPTMQAGQAQTLIICTGTHKETGQPCHAELDSEAEYCGKCGTPVPKPRVCSGKRKNGSPCQFKLPEDYECCPQCGTEVPSTEEEVPRRDYCTGTNKDGTPCKAELNHGQALCGKCGTPQNVSTDAVAEPESRSQAAQKGEDVSAMHI